MRHPGTLLVTAVLATSCGLGGGTAVPPIDADEAAAACRPGDCVVVDLAVAPEQAALLTELARDFNSSETVVGDRRVIVRPREHAPGDAGARLAAGWPDDPDDPRPVIWSPGSRAWGDILDARRAGRGLGTLAGAPTPVMRSPLVVAMPRRMAEALGHPARPVGWVDLADLARNPSGWASRGHPEWGSFRLGKTSPLVSTSGLLALVAQHDAAVARSGALRLEDLAAAEVLDSIRAIESAVVHYGDTTSTFLNNWYRSDQRGNPYRYASAVAVEERSIIDYNRGNPDGVTDAGEVPRPPRDPLVALYPAEGTIVSDDPLYILAADWVSPFEREGASAFVSFVLRRDSQAKIARAGFRPVDEAARAPSPLTPDAGVDPDQPRTTMDAPGGDVMVRMLDGWPEQAKGAKVLLVIDVSGSMGDEAAPGRTKLALATEATERALAQLRGDDLVGLRAFSTGLGPGQDQSSVDLAPVAPADAQRALLEQAAAGLAPANGTPLYTVTLQAVREMVAGYDPARINAVVLLTDGRNEDGDVSDDKRQRDELIRSLQAQTQGETGKPVRLFTIGYGEAADAAVLKDMAEATNGRYYGATADPTMITTVFDQVIANF